MDCVFSNFFFTLLRNFWNFLRVDTSIFFLSLLFGNFDSIQSIFSSFEKKNSFYFFPNLILNENFFLFLGFLCRVKFSKKKKGYQYNWRKLALPLCNPFLVFESVKKFSLCFFQRRTRARAAAPRPRLDFYRRRGGKRRIRGEDPRQVNIISPWPPRQAGGPADKVKET